MRLFLRDALRFDLRFRFRPASRRLAAGFCGFLADDARAVSSWFRRFHGSLTTRLRCAAGKIGLPLATLFAARAPTTPPTTAPTGPDTANRCPGDGTGGLFAESKFLLITLLLIFGHIDQLLLRVRLNLVRNGFAAAEPAQS